MREILQQYDDGDITYMQALRALCNELGETSSELEPLETQQEELRAAIERIIIREGAIDMPGFGRLSMVQGGVTSRYDTKRLDGLIVRLMQVDEHAIAAEIAECKVDAPRAGYLKIEREKR